MGCCYCVIIGRHSLGVLNISVDGLQERELWRLTLNAKRGNGDLFFAAHRFGGLIGQVFFDNEVVDNKLLTLHRIFTHIIFE